MIQELHDKLAEYIAGQHIAGASLRVRKCGSVVHDECIGHADIANGIPVDDRTVFRLASMTKPVIGVAIMMMAERGKLAISDPIAKYIPEFTEMKVAVRQIAPDEKDVRAAVEAMEYEPLRRAITIEDLLRHRSGLGHGPVSMLQGVLDTFPGMTLAQRVEKIASCPMDFQPGDSAGYSAVTAFDILGRILEIVSGKELEPLLRELLFDPLGMKDTTFIADERNIARIPRLYERRDEMLYDTSAPGVFANSLGFGFPCGSAGLYSTMEDYDRFVLMLAQRGKYGEIQLMKPETIDAMALPSPDDPATRCAVPTWGLSMCIFDSYENSGRYLSKGTFGWSGAYGTHFYIDPVCGVSMVLMVNRADIGGAGSYVSWGMEQEIYNTLCKKA